MQRKLTTIAAMDVVGYSRLMELDEAGTLDRLKDIRSSIIEPAVRRYSGRTVKLIGDGALLEFSTVVGALQCTVDIQRELARLNASSAEMQRLQMRIGIHLGDVIVEGDDIYGDGVNVAARLESIAPPGGIVLSKQVHDHIGTNVRVRFISIGDHRSRTSAGHSGLSGRLGPQAAGSDIIRFDEFELDCSRFELRKAGSGFPSRPQVFDVLVFGRRTTAGP